MKLNKNSINPLNKRGGHILFHIGIAISCCLFASICDSMELPTEKSAERRILTLNLKECLDDDFDSLCLNSDVTRGIKRNEIDSRNREYIYKKISEHTAKYPILFSKEAFDLEVNFLSDLRRFHESNLLLRVNEGESGIFNNEEYYVHLLRICPDYMELFYLSGPIINSDKKLDDFYKMGYSDMFQSSLMSCLYQKNACMVILKEINIFSTKLCIQISKGADKLSFEAIEWSKGRIDSLSDFVSRHSLFLETCINERKDFMFLLNDIAEFYVLGQVTLKDSLLECKDRLTTGSQAADKTLLQRKLNNASEEEKSMIRSNNSSESFEISVKRIPSDSSISSLESEGHETASGKTLPTRKSHRFRRSFSGKMDKISNSETKNKDEKKRDKDKK